MALDAKSLEQQIVSNLKAAGFQTDGEHSQAQVMAQAVAEAVVQHITQKAEVPVLGGSSAGSYKVI